VFDSGLATYYLNHIATEKHGNKPMTSTALATTDTASVNTVKAAALAKDTSKGSAVATLADSKTNLFHINPYLLEDSGNNFRNLNTPHAQEKLMNLARSIAANGVRMARTLFRTATVVWPRPRSPSNSLARLSRLFRFVWPRAARTTRITTSTSTSVTRAKPRLHLRQLTCSRNSLVTVGPKRSLSRSLAWISRLFFVTSILRLFRPKSTA
jgi:hypothetical protein